MYLFVYLCLPRSLYLCVCVPVCLGLCLSLSQPVHGSFFVFVLCLHMSASVCLSVCVCLCVSLSVPLCRWLCLYYCLCLCLCPCLWLCYCFCLCVCAVCISCRPRADVHKGEGFGPCGRMWTEGGGQKLDFCVRHKWMAPYTLRFPPFLFIFSPVLQVPHIFQMFLH